MTYEVLEVYPQHHCDLPNPKDFPLNTGIMCTTVREDEWGRYQCGATYRRSRTWWTRTPTWRKSL